MFVNVGVVSGFKWEILIMNGVVVWCDVMVKKFIVEVIE